MNYNYSKGIASLVLVCLYMLASAVLSTAQANSQVEKIEGEKYIEELKEFYIDYDPTVSFYDAVDTYKYCMGGKQWHQYKDNRNRIKIVFWCGVSKDSYMQYLKSEPDEDKYKRTLMEHNKNLIGFMVGVSWNYNGRTQAISHSRTITMAMFKDGKSLPLELTDEATRLNPVLKDIYDNENFLMLQNFQPIMSKCFDERIAKEDALLFMLMALADAVDIEKYKEMEEFISTTCRWG